MEFIFTLDVDYLEEDKMLNSELLLSNLTVVYKPKPLQLQILLYHLTRFFNSYKRNRHFNMFQRSALADEKDPYNSPPLTEERSCGSDKGFIVLIIEAPVYGVINPYKEDQIKIKEEFSYIKAKRSKSKASQSNAKAKQSKSKASQSNAKAKQSKSKASQSNAKAKQSKSKASQSNAKAKQSKSKAS